MDALERIEVAIRSAISDNLCRRYQDPHWYLREEVFGETFLTPVPPRNKSDYQFFQNKIIFHTGKNKHSHRNPSCRHYYDTYTEPKLPPSWMVIEVLPMGTWSIIFENIRTAKVRQKISKFFSFKTNDFGGWLHALTLMRNSCAHHNRFWNTNFPPKARNVARYTHTGITLNTPYANLAMIHAFLTSFTNQPTWSKRLFELLQGCPLNIHEHMAFPDEWETIPFWRIIP